MFRKYFQMEKSGRKFARKFEHKQFGWLTRKRA